MNHTPRFALACAVAALAVAPSLALSAVIMTESFTYPNGNLVGNGGWVAHSGAGAKAIQVSSGAIRVNQSAGSGEDVNRPHAAQANTATTYSMFKLTVPSVGPGGAPVHTTTDYFAHFRPTVNINNFRGRIYVGAPTGAGNFALYISVATAPGQSPVVAYPVDLSYDTQYTVVSSYDATTGTSQLWVNPTSSGSTSATSGPFAVGAGESIIEYAFRQGGSATNSVFQDIDDLQVHDAFPIVQTVPGTSEIALGLLAILMLGTGAVTVVRARANA